MHKHGGEAEEGAVQGGHDGSQTLRKAMKAEATARAAGTFGARGTSRVPVKKGAKRDGKNREEQLLTLDSAPPHAHKCHGTCVPRANLATWELPEPFNAQSPPLAGVFVWQPFLWHPCL